MSMSESRNLRDEVLKSYGLCLSRDDFVIDKCIWIVDLQDGTKVFQDDDRPGVQTPSAWKRLGFYVKDFPHNSIAKMRLRFGTHIINLPESQDFYFYSRGLLQAFTQKHGMNFHIVGHPTDDRKNIICTWYKAPELVITEEKSRTWSDCTSDQIIGNIPEITA